jgi:hypothetical protein
MTRIAIFSHDFVLSIFLVPDSLPEIATPRRETILRGLRLSTEAKIEQD